MTVMRKIDESFIAESLSSLISVSRSNLGIELQTPVIYPNGDLVSVTIKLESGNYIVHDGGNGSAILSASGVSLTKKIAERLNKIAEHYGCEFVSGRMLRTCTPDDVGVCAAIVANASRSIGDQSLLRDQQPILDFRREVLERVRNSVGGRRYRENEEVVGESGSAYRISAVILDDGLEGPVGFVEPVKDHEAATKKFREFWDISESERYSGVLRISLYNEAWPWRAGDLSLLQRVSNVVRLADTEARMKEFLGA
jgi:hypothetical protein